MNRGATKVNPKPTTRTSCCAKILSHGSSSP